MASPPPEDQQASSNDRLGPPSDLTSLPSEVYDELRALAHQLIHNWNVGGTLQTTALVHEAYLRLANRPDSPFRNRAHFLGVAAKAMRSVLVDDVRRRCAGKRVDGKGKISLDQALICVDEWNPDLLALNEVLDRLASFDARKAQVVELRFFGGCTIEETAKVIGVSPATIKRDWNLAKAWLFREIHQGESNNGSSS